MLRKISILSAIVLSLACTPGPQGPPGEKGDPGENGTDGRDGADGEDGTSCTVTDNADGTMTISCADGTNVTVADGADGADGHNSLIRTTSEPPGGNCPGGGVAIDSGIDTNGNGVLDDDEIQSENTTYICDGEDREAEPCGVIEGSVIVTNELDLQALRGCTEITGQLKIDAPGLTSLEGLESLTHVGEDLLIFDNNLTTLEGLSSLTSVGGNFHIECHHIIDMQGLSSLNSVGSSIQIYANEIEDLAGLGPITTPQGIHILAPKLQSLAGLEALVSYNGINIGDGLFTTLQGINGNSNKGSVAITSAYHITDLSGLQNFTDLNLSIGNTSIRDLGGTDSSIKTLGLSQNNQLTTLVGINLSSQIDRIVIDQNPMLSDISPLMSVDSINHALIVNNESLPQCAVDQLAETFGLICGSAPFSCGGNNATGTCD